MRINLPHRRATQPPELLRHGAMIHTVRFIDRADAGRQLAEKLAGLELADPLVLALPRGGVPVAAEVAARIGAELDVVVARKVGAPSQPELGIGAIAEGGIQVVDEEMLSHLGVSRAEYDRVETAERDELERRVRRYRGDRPLPDLTRRDVILVDDGLATGVTAEAALQRLRQLSPRLVVLAVPVCAAPTVERVSSLADRVVCVMTPHNLGAVGSWYNAFSQTSDAEVESLLALSRRRSAPPG